MLLIPFWPEYLVPVCKLVRETHLFHLGLNSGSFWYISAEINNPAGAFLLDFKLILLFSLISLSLWLTEKWVIKISTRFVELIWVLGGFHFGL